MPQRSILDNAFKLDADVDKRSYESDSKQGCQNQSHATSLVVIQNSPPNNDRQSKEGRDRGFLQQIIVIPILVKRQNGEIDHYDSQNDASLPVISIQQLAGQNSVKTTFQQPE